MTPFIGVNKSDIEIKTQHINESKKRIAIILSIHTLERFLFFSISIVIPLNLFSEGKISSSDMGFFYLVLFAFYRGTPVLFGYISSFIHKEKILYVSLTLEILSLVCMSLTEKLSYIYFLSFFAGSVGGATTMMIISLLEAEDKKCKLTLHNKVDHGIFNIHFMLINAAAFITPFLALFSRSNYQAIILITASTLLFLLIFFILFNKRSHFSSQLNPIHSVINSQTKFDFNFLYIWLACVSVWAACSTFYAIIPSLDSSFFGVDGINAWFSLDAAAVVLFFFVLNRIKILTKNTAQNAFIGMIILATGLFLIPLFKNDFLYCAIAIIIISFGGYIAFPQLYGLAVKTNFQERKVLYLSLMTFSGAVGEGCMHTLFWITGNASFCLFLSAVLLITNAFLIKRCKILS